MPPAPLLTDHLDHWAAHRGTEWALAAVEFPVGDMTGSRRSLTWSRLRARALAVADRIARTARPGDRAALLLPQGLDYVAAFLGCLYAGVVAVPLFTPALFGHQGRLAAVLADAAPRCLLTDSGTMQSVQAFADRYCREAVVIAVDRRRDATGAAEREAPAGTPSTDPDSPAYLQYTSGSTRTPAGVVVSHRNIVANARQAVDAYVGRGRLTAVGWLPLFHDMGLVLSVAAPVTGGFPSVLMDPSAFLYRPARWLRLLAQYPGSVSAAPDFAYDYCARRVSAREAASLRLHRVTCLINGGEPVRWQTVQRFHEAFAPSGLRPETHCPSYGLAEATVFVSADRPDRVPTHVAVDRDALAGGKIVTVGSDTPQAAHFVTCGTPAGQRILIADPETGAPLPDGEVGEIRVQGPNVAAAYQNRPDTSEETFQARIPGEDGRWLRTGDLGAVHDGALLVTGRLKDLVIVDGRNHYPQDIEASIEAALPVGRHRTAAFTVPAEGGDGGERLVVVAERTGGTGTVCWDAVQITAAARAAVSAGHGLRLADLRLVPPGAVPRTSSGKISRTACRVRYLEGAWT
ncbi:fatty acyl-AMP ligase [Streptomyces sp. 7N604]|uniref:fatty acyl-AMP ligase n=1 Tax=Streptomyces sp. 7N604 TaxID=3457415 RepID=UPI003FD4F08D